MLLNWEFKQIADFMNKTRPLSSPRVADTIYKQKNAICRKLNIYPTYPQNLLEFLVSIDFHNNISNSFFNHMIGSNPL